METVNKLSIKRVLSTNEALCLSLRRNSTTLDKGVSDLAKMSGLNEQFIRLHIDQIRNWL